jgi:hypothetical protein
VKNSGNMRIWIPIEETRPETAAHFQLSGSIEGSSPKHSPIYCSLTLLYSCTVLIVKKNYFTKENIQSLLITFFCTFAVYDSIIFFKSLKGKG